MIVCEDDVLFAVFTIGAFSRRICTRKDYYHLLPRSGFTPWGWATWSDRWVEIEAGLRARLDDADPWDVITNHDIRKDRLQVVPVLARTQNIGSEDGTYCPGPDFHRAHQFNEFRAGVVDVGEGVFGEPADPPAAIRFFQSVFRTVVGRTPARQLWAWRTRCARRRIIRQSQR